MRKSPPFSLKLKGYSKITLKKDKFGIFEVKVKINGCSGLFFLDTGATSCCINRGDLSKFELKKESKKGKVAGLGTSSMSITTAVAKKFEVGSFSLGSYRFGVLNLKHINVARKGLHMDPIQGVFGIDVLRAFSAFIDCKKSNLYLKK